MKLWLSKKKWNKAIIHLRCLGRLQTWARKHIVIMWFKIATSGKLKTPLGHIYVQTERILSKDNAPPKAIYMTNIYCWGKC